MRAGRGKRSVLPSNASVVPSRSAITVSRRSSSSSSVNAASARSSESWPSRIGRRLRTKRSLARARTASASSDGSSGGASASIVRRKARSPSAESSAARASSIQRLMLMPTVMCSESSSDVSAWWSQPAREVERVAGAQGGVEHRLAGLAEGGAVPLVLQRQLQHRLVDEPALRARHLERDHLVRVVVHG